MFRAVIFSLEEHHPYRSLGAHRIASFLRQHGWNIEVINYANHFSLDELQTIFRQRYDENLKFIGASCNFGTFSKEFDIYCNWIKENFPHIKILVGGQYLPEMMTNAADYFITGYGENAMLVLLKYLFSNGSSVKFTIVNGKKVVEGDTVKAIAFTDSYSMACDSIFYYNSDSSIQSLLEPYHPTPCGYFDEELDGRHKWANIISSNTKEEDFINWYKNHL